MPDSPGGRWQDRADKHAPLAALHPGQRRGDFYWPADEIDSFCVACVPELDEHGWRHERSCVFARRERTA